MRRGAGYALSKAVAKAVLKDRVVHHKLSGSWSLKETAVCTTLYMQAHAAYPDLNLSAERMSVLGTPI